jgi:hypothetical protein
MLQGVTKLIGRDRLVTTGAYPRLHRVAKPFLLQQVDQPLQTAGSLNQLTDDGHHGSRTGLPALRGSPLPTQ